MDFALPVKHLDGDAGYKCVIFQSHTNHNFGVDVHFVLECKPGEESGRRMARTNINFIVPSA